MRRPVTAILAAGVISLSAASCGHTATSTVGSAGTPPPTTAPAPMTSPTTAPPTGQAPPCGHGAGRGATTVTLRLSDTSPAPAVDAGHGRIITVVSHFGGGKMLVPVPSRGRNHVCLLSERVGGGTSTAKFVALTDGDVSFSSGFTHPGATMDPAMRGTARIVD